MFIHSIEIENFKGFGSKQTLEFNTPDGMTDGSGLNIFVGENNSGKSTIFEAISFIKDGTKKNIADICNKSNTLQSKHLTVEMTFTGNLTSIFSEYIQDNKLESFKNCIFKNIDSEFFKVKRSSENNSEKKILFWNNDQYKNLSGIDAPFKSIYDNNFIWADTNPEAEAKFGTSTICGALLKEIAQNHIETPEYIEFTQSFQKLFNEPDSDLRQKITEIENKIQNIFKEQFGNADINFNFEALDINSFFKTVSIFVDDGISVPMGEKGHGMQRAIALSLLQVYADLTSTTTNTTLTKPFYLYIDEPEICLHPLGQKKLLAALMKISRNKQVFITTHSPLLLSHPSLRQTGLFIFKKNDQHENIVEKANTAPFFPWSPSWGEICFKAYKLSTIELQNELYGFLQDHSGIGNQDKFDNWLQQHGISKCKQWTREKNGIPQNTQNVTLQTFIRNHIHHPENITMHATPYSEAELTQSITEMTNLLIKP